MSNHWRQNCYDIIHCKFAWLVKSYTLHVLILLQHYNYHFKSMQLVYLNVGNSRNTKQLTEKVIQQRIISLQHTKRMSKYTNELEHIVDDRTQLLLLNARWNIPNVVGMTQPLPDCNHNPSLTPTLTLNITWSRLPHNLPCPMPFRAFPPNFVNSADFHKHW